MIGNGYSGTEQVPAESYYLNGTSSPRTKLHTFNNRSINKSGYLYIYVSNETPNINVFFDNLQVTHIRGALQEETHYYPFGLRMAGISYRTSGISPNKKAYNGNELQSREFIDESGLELYDFNARTYDPQIGRFIQIDPTPEDGDQESLTEYHFSGNNPSTFNDPDGKCPWCWGAVVGALVEYGSQVASNLVQGKSLSESLTQVDGSAILISAVAGAVSGGVSAFVPKTTVAKVAVAGMKLAVDATESAAKQYNENGYVTIKNTLVDVGTNAVAGKLTNNLTVSSNIAATEKSLNRAKRISAGDPASTGRATTVKKLSGKLAGKKAANSMLQQGASGVVANTAQGLSQTNNTENPVLFIAPVVDNTVGNKIIPIKLK